MSVFQFYLLNFSCVNIFYFFNFNCFTGYEAPNLRYAYFSANLEMEISVEALVGICIVSHVFVFFSLVLIYVFETSEGS